MMAIFRNKLLKRRAGFSLAELSVVVLVMMILAAGLFLSYDWIRDSAKRSVTLKDLESLQSACRMYMGHKKDGAVPANLGVLLVELPAADSVDGVKKGPYIKKADWTAEESTWVDAWGNPFIYDATARTIKSSGGVTADRVEITVSF